MEINAVSGVLGIKCFLEGECKVGVPLLYLCRIFQYERSYEHMPVHVALAEGAEWMILAPLLRLEVHSLLTL